MWQVPVRADCNLLALKLWHTGLPASAHEPVPCADSCPINCIHWVDRHELPVLEHVMKHMGRINVGTMSAYNYNTLDVFTAATEFRKKKAEGRTARKSWVEVRFG